MSEPDAPLPSEVAAALAQGNAIEAVKRLRKATGLSLTEALAVIGRHAAAQARGAQPASSAAKQAGAFTDAHDAPQQRVGGLAPGEVPRRSSSPWIVAALVALVYYYIHA